MSATIFAYNSLLRGEEKEIAKQLSILIDQHLTKAESKIWHRHPVWFIEGNPIVGYSKQKSGMRLMFWSGASFDEADLKPGTGKFKDASIIFTKVTEIKATHLKRWLKKAEKIQWDYKNVVKRKGVLIRI